MIITSANVAEQGFALRDLLKDSQAVQDIGARVELAEPVNQDPSACPWVGVYPLRVAFPSRVLGMGAGYRGQDGEFVVLCQETHANDGAACFESLGLLVQAVTGAILSDPGLKGTVLNLADFEVEFLGVLKVDDAIMQTASVRLVAQTTVSGG